MARVSKEPLRMFSVNIKKARVLAGLQPFFDDIITTGGKKTIGITQEIVFDLLSDAQGITRKEFEKKISKAMEKAIKPPNMKKFNQEIENAIKKNQNQFKSLISLFKNIKIAKSRVLLEQSVVIGVTALEVFCQDITISAISQNKFIEKRFYKEIKKNFNYEKLIKMNYASKKAIGMTVVSTYSCFDIDELKTHFRRLTGVFCLVDLDHETELKRIMAYRNVIVHQGGIVDYEFKRKIKDATIKIGEPVPINLPMVENWLKIIDEIAEKINEKVRGTKETTPGVPVS